MAAGLDMSERCSRLRRHDPTVFVTEALADGAGIARG